MKLETLERGMAHLSPEDFRRFSERVSQAVMESLWPPITKMELFLTRGCNLRCRYCWDQKKPARPMSWPVAKKAVDRLVEWSRDDRNLSITLFGGEPLLQWELFKRIVTYAERRAAGSRKKVGWACTTNGILLDEERLKFGAEHAIPYLLSIDGSRRTHNRYRRFPDGKGSFDAVRRVIPLVKRIQPWLGTRMTVNPPGVRALASDVEFLYGLGINQFLIGFNAAAHWRRADLSLLTEQYRAVAEWYVGLRVRGGPVRMEGLDSAVTRRGRQRGIWGCEAARDKVAVTPDGSIYPCAQMVGDEALMARFWLGDLERGIVNQEARREMTDARDSLRYHCSPCEFKDDCAGICPVVNLQAWGTPYRPHAAECAKAQMFFTLARDLPSLARASAPSLPQLTHGRLIPALAPLAPGSAAAAPGDVCATEQLPVLPPPA